MQSRRLEIQVVLYGTSLRGVRLLTEACGAAAAGARASGIVDEVVLALGDCSPSSVVAGQEERDLAAAAARAGLDGFRYEHFGANLGSSGGNNRLAESGPSEAILILNPDTYLAPSALAHLLSAWNDPTVGAADARQIPCEHPKDYDRVTGDTSWASGSCLLVRSSVYNRIGGFDSEHFFLYCNDVDLSWRIRLAGQRVVHIPRAVVFHDKRVDRQARVMPTAHEQQSALFGRLMLARRYGRDDIVAETLEHVKKMGTPQQRAAVEEWNRWKEAGRLPPAIENADRVAEFIDGEYAVHRFVEQAPAP